MSRLLRLGGTALGIAAGGVVIGIYFPELRSTANQLVVLVVLGLVLSELTRAAYSLRPRGRTPFDRALGSEEQRPNRPADLLRLERSLGWGVYTRTEFDHRVRPLLLRLLGPRLRARGVDPERRPGAAQELLPPELAALLDDAPSEADGRWADTASIRGLVQAIEEGEGGNQ